MVLRCVALPLEQKSHSYSGGTLKSHGTLANSTNSNSNHNKSSGDHIGIMEKKMETTIAGLCSLE